jgi:hypothetical protein
MISYCDIFIVILNAVSLNDAANGSTDFEHSDDDTMDDDAVSIATLSFIHCVVHVATLPAPKYFSIPANATVESAIGVMLSELDDASVCGDVSEWRLAKVDRSMLITRVWMDPTQLLHAYRVKDGVRPFLNMIDSFTFLYPMNCLCGCRMNCGYAM